MAALRLEFTPRFKRDFKRAEAQGRDMAAVAAVLSLIRENTASSRDELRRRHRMHQLTGGWKGSIECHVCNAGDWLMVWAECEGMAYLQRLGSHSEIFR